MRPIRVLHCIPHVHLGGADLCAISLVRSLDEINGIDARLCVFQGTLAPPQRLVGLKDPILMNFQGVHARLDEFLKFRTSLREAVRSWQPDIVHSHLWPACRWSTSALLGTGVKQVWHIHDTRQWIESSKPRDRIFRAWTRWILTREEPVLLSVSRAAARYSAKPLGFRPERCHVVPCGVDPDRFRVTTSPGSGRMVVGLAAQFRAEKGHDVLLRAVKLLAKRGVEVELRLAGDGPTLERMQELAVELGLDRQVRFLGHVDDVPGFLSELDLFVLPSIAFEGLPVCLLEAMTMRVPVVATAVAGTPEIVHNGVTGRLVPPGNVEALAEAMADHFVGEQVWSELMIDQAEALVRDSFTIRAVAARVVEIYRHALKGAYGDWTNAA